MRWMLVLLFACGSTGSGGGADDGSGTAASCKRGIAYGHNSMPDLKALSSGISWWYNWALSPDDAVATSYAQTGVEYVPMIWGSGSLASSPSFTTSEKYVLTFNEPDFTAQANLTPQMAADLWPQVEASANGLPIVSPALNYCGGGCNETDPFMWFDKFFAACPNCKVDYLAVHWYACTLDALTNYIGKMKAYGKPIWLTEFACLDDSDTSLPKQQAYMADALTYLEGESSVMRYAWFTGRSDSTPSIDLLGDSGQLTALGSQYVDAAGSCSQ